ncbi:synaptotagmin-like protein 2 isoform X4 [Engraulis encrasicolus]|uniref:synaptotagmin-like protein 2 isoform X4 n=1 Tax=Engraulis encrasicolus TaxID=184585 RepID=UPI002FCE6BFF
MIDLSHLTEEEQEKILAVLKRDADLKKRDTMRVKELHKTVRDKNRLKYLTGDWFYETKSRRHNDKIHGCDIIRASIRQRRPVTIFELSKLWAEKAGTTDSTSAPEESQRNPASTPENQSDGPRPAPQSKQRQNPFNNTPASPVFRGEGGSRRLSNGKAHAGTAPVGELLPSPESPIATLTNQSSESSEHSQGSPNPPRPVPRKRLLHVSPNSSVDNNEPAFKPSTVPSPKSILKQSPRSSPIRSPIRSPIGSSLVPLSLPRCPSAEPSQTSLDLPESPCSGSGTLDKKQVQFSGSVRGRNAARRRSSQDSVENDFLDGDVLVASDDEGSDSSSSSSSEEEEEVDVSSEAHSTSREDSPIFLDPPPRNDSRLSIYSQSSSDSSRVSNSRPVNGGVVVITGYHDNVAETPASKVPSRYATWTDTGNSQNTTPVRGILKRPASRPMSFSKSMEDITTMPAREERMNSEQKSDHMLSMDNVSAAPPSPCSTLDTDQMKRMSASVPAFLQQESDERDSDCASDNSMNSPHHQWRLNSLTNNSVSGMSTTSSVSGSVMSIYSVDYGNVEVKGTIQFAMNYVEKLGEFHIFVVQCRDLAVAEPKRNRSDPYVKCYLLPDKAKLGKRKTSVKKKTFNPTFNEILRYKIPCEVLRSTILNLSVWHNDNFGRNSFLGEVDVDLNEWSITDTQMKHYLLRPRVVTQPSTEDHRGDLKVAVRFLPKVTQSKRASKSGELQIWVKECRNLPVVRGAIIDPFVKCTVLPDSFKKSRQKTRVAKKTADPVFNHTMVYDGLRPEDLCEICVELTVWDHDRLTNHFLGGCRLGLGTGKSYGTDVDWMDSSSEEAALWSQMMTSQGEWIEDVFPLRMLMMARSMSK